MSEPNPSPDAATEAGSGPLAVMIVVVGVVAAIALTVSLIAVGADEDDGPDASAAPVALALTEFSLDPAVVTVGVGGSLEVTNEGAVAHNVMIEGTDLITPDLNGGESAVLDLSSLSPGEYELLCEIAGHAAAGMTGTLIISEDGAATSASDHGHDGDETDWAALDEAMMSSMAKFPAETEGVGNARLEPELLADGTKRFELTAEIVEWEVEPGKFVEAWTYNGMVPGPWIKVDVGDKVQVHIQNDLPMGTDIHWHGIKTPNAMDGVAPITQELIRSGEDFIYEFTARNQSLGMYHAHHHAQMQVPNGMLGVFQIGDAPLPGGQTISGTTIPEDIADLIALELPMVLNDAGTIGYSLNGKSFPATAPVVVEEGSWVLVHYLNEGLQIHPMHQHQFPQLVVAKDGIPLDNPYWADTINVAPGERYSVLLNADEAGVWVWHCHILNHVEREEGMFGMVTALVVT